MEWTRTHWWGFIAGVSILLFFDLFVLNRKKKQPTFKTALLWTMFWCSCAILFNLFIYQVAGIKKAMEFFTGYIVEWSLSMDNVFVFAVVFNFFKVPLKNQHRVLFWGIIGAVILRFGFVVLGTELIKNFEWMIAIFGAILIYTGLKLLTHDEERVNPDHNIIMRLGRKFLPVYPGSNYERFFIRENGKFYVTSLFLVLLVIESTDVLFAVDSVPAVFGITKDPYIVFTSNIAAILGLRSLYFMLAGVVQYFRYLNYGLCVILVFVGSKMNIEYWFHDPSRTEHLLGPGPSLAVICSILAIAIGASVLLKGKK